MFLAGVVPTSGKVIPTDSQGRFAPLLTWLFDLQHRDWQPRSRLYIRLDQPQVLAEWWFQDAFRG